MSFRILFLIGSFSLWALAQGETDTKPVCTAKIQGQLWPKEANTDSAKLMERARAGKLEMCIAGDWGWKWKTLTVNVKQSPRKQSDSSKEVVPKTVNDKPANVKP